MNEPIRTQWQIRCAFNGFCKLALKREAMNAHRDTKQRQLREVTFGKPQFVYAWKLVPTDKTPAGKREDISLREKEKEIQASLLSFMQNDKIYRKYLDEVIILLGTGLRISELCGLTEADIDFENKLINIDHQLLKISEIGYHIETPKTKSGIRQIPMSQKVYEAFERVMKERRQAKPLIVGGYSRFLFLNRNGLPKVAVNYETMFRGLAKKYNKCHEEALPKVMTPHTLRHTFCTNLANAGMNPKALQYIMGHSNINMTLNYYAHATSDSAVAEMERLIA